MSWAVMTWVTYAAGHTPATVLLGCSQCMQLARKKSASKLLRFVRAYTHTNTQQVGPYGGSLHQ